VYGAGGGRGLGGDPQTLPKLLMSKLKTTPMNDILANDIDNERFYFESDTRFRTVGCTSAFVHRLCDFYPSHEAVLKTQLFEVLKVLDMDLKSDDRIQAIMETMLSPDIVEVEQVVNLMRSVENSLLRRTVEEPFLWNCYRFIIFSGMLGWVAKKALDPAVSREQRVLLAISTAAAVYSLIEHHYTTSELMDQLVEQPCLKSLCELWGYEDGALLRNIHRDSLTNINNITFYLCYPWSKSPWSLSSFHKVPGMLRAGWAKLVMKVLQASLSIRPLNEEAVLSALQSISWLLSTNNYASKAPLRKAGAAAALAEARRTFPNSVVIKSSCDCSTWKLSPFYVLE